MPAVLGTLVHVPPKDNSGDQLMGSSGPADHGTMALVGRADQVRGSPGWLIDETANAGRENLDVAHVERYDGKMDSRALDVVALLDVVPQSARVAPA